MRTATKKQTESASSVAGLTFELVHDTIHLVELHDGVAIARPVVMAPVVVAVNALVRASFRNLDLDGQRRQQVLVHRAPP